jgi:hypothetical protein
MNQSLLKYGEQFLNIRLKELQREKERIKLLLLLLKLLFYLKLVPLKLQLENKAIMVEDLNLSQRRLKN